MIVAMTALYHALRGKKVDIFTSSAVLAETETRPGTEVYSFYKLFGITVGNNCSSLDEETSMKAYKNQVIYGTSFNFQADYLKKVFSGKIRFF
jgi:preprotein translocase subunit SecA